MNGAIAAARKRKRKISSAFQAETETSGPLYSFRVVSPFCSVYHGRKTLTARSTAPIIDTTSPRWTRESDTGGERIRGAAEECHDDAPPPPMGPDPPPPRGPPGRAPHPLPPRPAGPVRR